MSLQEKEALTSIITILVILTIGPILWFFSGMLVVSCFAGIIALIFNLYNAITHQIEKRRGSVTQDERDVTVRHKAYVVAFTTSCAILGLWFLTAVILSIETMAMPLPVVAGCILFQILFSTFALSAATLYYSGTFSFFHETLKPRS